jgi:hypothetical protein
MDLKKQTIEDLQRILKKDYGISINETDANSLGVSLLRLSNIAITVCAREAKNNNIMSKNNLT